MQSRKVWSVRLLNPAIDFLENLTCAMTRWRMQKLVIILTPYIYYHFLVSMFSIDNFFFSIRYFDTYIVLSIIIEEFSFDAWCFSRFSRCGALRNFLISRSFLLLNSFKFRCLMVSNYYYFKNFVLLAVSVRLLSLNKV